MLLAACPCQGKDGLTLLQITQRNYGHENEIPQLLHPVFDPCQ